MGSTFNPQILVEKLAKLNSTQQSIETLSHWCIFHMNKAKHVVETWARQFHCSPRDQRLAFLYLANDILQNSRRKGSEFVGEFWKVLPDALRDVIDNGDEVGRNAAFRLISIWEERKVFGSRGQILKEEVVGRHLETNNRNGKHSGLKLKQSAGNALDKIVSGYQIIYGGQLDEDALISKCRSAISSIEKVDKEIADDIRPEVSGSSIVEELKGQHAILRDCIAQLTAVESSRANLVSYMREALQEQENKLDQVRNQLQAAHAQSEQADNIFRQLIGPTGAQLLPEQDRKETLNSNVEGYVPTSGEQSAPVMYTRQIPLAEQSEEDTKSAAAAVAAKLTASTSSAEMLSYVLSSLASEGVIGNSLKESSSNDFPSEKRAKIENEQSHSPYVASSQQLIPPFQHPESLQHNGNAPVTSHEPSHDQQPPPPSSPPPLPPMPPMQPYPMPQFMQTAGTVTYTYSTNQQPPPPLPLPGYPTVGPPINSVSSYTPVGQPNAYQNYQMEGGFYNQPSSVPMAPMSRQ